MERIQRVDHRKLAAEPMPPEAYEDPNHDAIFALDSQLAGYLAKLDAGVLEPSERQQLLTLVKHIHGRLGSAVPAWRRAYLSPRVALAEQLLDRRC